MTDPTSPAPPTKRKAAPRKRPPGAKAATDAVPPVKAPTGTGRRAKKIPVPAMLPSTVAVAVQSPTPVINLIRVAMPVRWRDLDAFNHVNNSKYLSYLEEARLQWMLTVPGHGMDDHVAPVVAAAQLSYRRPIEWPNEVAVELFVERLGNTSLTMGHRIVGATDPDVLFCDGNVVMVWIDRDSGRAAPLPDAVREACSATPNA